MLGNREAPDGTSTIEFINYEYLSRERDSERSVP